MRDGNFQNATTALGQERVGREIDGIANAIEDNAAAIGQLVDRLENMRERLVGTKRGSEAAVTGPVPVPIGAIERLQRGCGVARDRAVEAHAIMDTLEKSI